MNFQKTILILGANSDVAKEAIRLYAERGDKVIAASRSVDELRDFVARGVSRPELVTILYFDAVAFEEHRRFYERLPEKPHIVVYAAGYLKNNEEAMRDWTGAFRMMQVHYA